MPNSSRHSKSFAAKFAGGSRLLLRLMYRSLILLKNNDPLRMAGATAFFSTFALPPIIFIILRLFGFFVDRRTFARQMLDRLSDVLGQDSGLLIRETLRNVRDLNISLITATLGFIFLMFIATTLFVVIRNSLDQIWCIGVKSGVGIWFGLKQRATSLAIILLAGVLFGLALGVETGRSILGNYFSIFKPGTNPFWSNFLNELIFALIVTVWFAILFRFITDGRPAWRNALLGGFFTALLFTPGKLTIHYFLNLSNITTIYSTSAAMVLTLLFLFYSAIIFYYGGCFVKVLSDHSKEPIIPVKGAYAFEVHETIVKKVTES